MWRLLASLVQVLDSLKAIVLSDVIGRNYVRLTKMQDWVHLIAFYSDRITALADWHSCSVILFFVLWFPLSNSWDSVPWLCLCLTCRFTQGHFHQMRDVCLCPVIGSQNPWVLFPAVTYSEWPWPSHCLIFLTAIKDKICLSSPWNEPEPEA